MLFSFADGKSRSLVKESKSSPLIGMMNFLGTSTRRSIESSGRKAALQSVVSYSKLIGFRRSIRGCIVP